jgi:hypothetical protein
MRPSNKLRSRNKNNNRRNNNNSSNVVNRVLDSAGPDGRVRGTPQQIIEKYRGLAHDALMADDRVAAESFQQHAEHYNRLLSVAQRQAEQRQAEQQARQAEQQARQVEQQARQAKQQQHENQDKSDNQQPESGFVEVSAEQPDVADNLVTTPESKQRRQRRKPESEVVSEDADPATEDQPQTL